MATDFSNQTMHPEIDALTETIWVENHTAESENSN